MLRFGVLFAVTFLVGITYIQAQGEKVVREPRVVNKQNSQNMELLKGHHNPSAKTALSNKVALVDDSALVSDQPIGGSEFIDYGTSGNGQISVYVVRQGDTLSAIAKMFGVSVNTIAWANDIKGGKISPGQTLVILPISGVRHTVVKGDTVQSIAKKYKADLDEILSYNNISLSDKLAIGEEVIIPDGEITSVSNSSSGSYSNVSAPSGYYGRPLVGGRRTQGLHGHNGVDFGAPVGTPVLASAEGTVIIARSSGWNGGYGLYVVVSHANGTQTLYSHLSSVNVSTGERVSKGQNIGRVGNTGKSTGPHLHFEVRGAKNPF